MMNKRIFDYIELVLFAFLQVTILIATLLRGGHSIAFLLLFFSMDIPLLVFGISKNDRIKALISAVFSSFALNIDMMYPKETECSEYEVLFFRDDRLLVLLAVLALYCLYLYILKATKKIRGYMRGRLIISCVSCLLAIFILFGYSYQETDSWDMVFLNSYQMSKSIFSFVGLFFVFYYCIAWIYSLADKCLEDDNYNIKIWKPVEWYLKELRDAPFKVAFITMVIINLPYMITAYPGIFAGDTIDQILQAFQIPYNSAKTTNLINPDQLINQHHSVLHTMLIHWLLLFGVKMFHSANIGIFLVVIIQTMLTFAAVAYLIKTVSDEGISDIHLLILMLFFCFSPRIQNMLFVLSKDVPYGALTLFSIILLWKLLAGRQSGGGIKAAYILCLTFMLLLRKEAIYIIVLQMIVMLIFFRENRRVWRIVLVIMISIHFVLGRIVYPALEISPSPECEALSIPIQQTARYLRDFPDDVTPKEKEAINRMWEYDELCQAYDPVVSDPAKVTFRKTSGISDWLEYFGAWKEMFFKHPTVYFQAFLNNYYEYFYPGRELSQAHTFERRAWDIDYANEMLEEEGVFIHYPKGMDWARKGLEYCREKVFRLPVLSVFLSVACYTWVLIVSFAYWIYRRNQKAMLVFLPLILILLVCISGPCNGSYFRYFYPILLCLPASISLSWIIEKEGRKN